jgi:hypothetical protein
MCYWILPQSGVPIARSTVQTITANELKTEVVQQELASLDDAIKVKLGAHHNDDNPKIDLRLYMEDDDENDNVFDTEPFEPEARIPDVDVFEPDQYDELLLAEPLLPRDNVLHPARIIGRKRDQDGNPSGNNNPNPLLNTRVYLAEFEDGYVAEYSANMIAEAIYNQVDDNGFDEVLFKDIVGHHKGEQALNESDVQNAINADIAPIRTTKSWDICIEWRDGSSSWHPMNKIKNSFPLHLAEYAVKHGIQEELAFKWWIKEAFRRKKYMIKAAQTRYARRTHKFGIKLPNSVDEALAIDRETNTTYWFNAIQKEMKNVKVAFKFLDPGERVPIGYKWIRCHLIFDVKMDFTRKARYVAGGHMTDPPSTLTYSSVVSRDSVRIGFLLAVLNDLDLLAVDVGNAYLNAPTREHVYTTAVLEFGAELQGKPVLIVKALYGLKTSRAARRAHFTQTLHELNFQSCLADPDVWFRPAVKANGFHYYEYILVYVDDLLVLSHQPTSIMKNLEAYYRLKDGFEKPK